jgi:hypothetical protein
MTRARGIFVLGAVVATLTAAPAASAVIDPGTFATARDGRLLVVSSVLVANRNVEMMGGWNKEGAPCNRTRRLNVRILIDRVRGGNTTRFTEHVSAPVQNCPEGGPNLGFQLSATDAGMACPNGRWRPGQYTFVTNTRHRASGLRAIASLFFRERDAC